MNEEAKVLSRGRVTVPAKVRKELGVSAGDRLSFEIKNGVVYVCPVRPVRPDATGRTEIDDR
jgi:AbrB family looped-hinge helix DNA binding protein